MNTGHSRASARKPAPYGTLSSSTMMVIMMALPLSLKASRRIFPIRSIIRKDQELNYPIDDQKLTTLHVAQQAEIPSGTILDAH